MLISPVARAMVVKQGKSVDKVILASARDHEAMILNNQCSRNLVDQHPEVAVRGHLLRGDYRAGRLWLNFALTNKVIGAPSAANL